MARHARCTRAFGRGEERAQLRIQETHGVSADSQQADYSSRNGWRNLAGTCATELHRRTESPESACAARKMSVLLQISDPHFGTEQAPVVKALLELAHRIAPEVIVISGDLTQRGRSAQFRAAREFCNQLPAAPQLVVPGNHDIPLFNVLARVALPYWNYRRAFGNDFEPRYESDNFFVVGINTTRPYR